MLSLYQYQSELFIDRPSALEELQEWASAITDKLVLSLVGPPGSGKTWLARQLSGAYNIPAFDLDDIFWRWLRSKKNLKLPNL